MRYLVMTFTRQGRRHKHLIWVVIILTVTIINQAESYRSREYLVDIATIGDLVIVGKLSKIETKRDAQTGLTYTEVSVEVQQVIRNVTKQDIKAGTVVYFRQLGGDTDFNLYDTTFHKDWISRELPHPYGWGFLVLRKE